MLINVVAPIGKVPMYKLCTGSRIIRDQMPGKRMYRAAVMALKRMKSARLRKKKASVKARITGESLA
jgi:hypothetical protein